jgi:hypothetical protein
MKMSALVILLLAGLAVCGFLLRRQAPRVPAGAASVPPRAENLQPVDAWQQSIRLAPVGDYQADEKTRRRLIETLRREEDRQRPQEGRN